MSDVIPRVQTDDRNINQLQANINNAVSPLLKNPVTHGVLQTVTLASGSNTINHNLGRALQGWIIVRQRGSAQVYDSQDSNTNQDLTLILVSSAGVTVDIYCF